MSNRVPTLPVTIHPGRATLHAMVTAAAMIACADGHVARSERRSLLRFLSHHGVLARHGRAASLAAFEQAIRDTEDLGPHAAADRLRAIAGLPGAPLVAQAAAHVALADGVTWPQEIALLEVIRDRVGLPAGPAR